MSGPTVPLTPSETAAKEAKALKEGYVHRALVGLDQFVNVLTGGLPDETISARSARAAEQGKGWGVAMSKFLNLFQANHGPKAQAGDAARAQRVTSVEKASGGIDSGQG